MAIGELLTVAPGHCTVAPRSLDELRALVAEPAAGTPDFGRRDFAATGTPVDPQTTGDVIETVVEFASCLGAGDCLRAYALYSDNMVRLAATYGALTPTDVDALARGQGHDAAGATRTVVVSEVRLFPDGRSGAVVIFDGELAYLTFVHDGDRWLIDAWDDDDGPATPMA